MVTFKIRVPYKVGNPEDIAQEIANKLLQSESITYGLDDNSIMIRFGHHEPNTEYDLRLLEIKGE